MTNKKVLLLGAGFTANFGAPISKQIWNDLFNYPAIQSSNRLRTILKTYQLTGDFEGFFAEIINGKQSTQEEKTIVAIAVIEIFERINTSIESTMINRNLSDISFEKLLLFLKRFSNMEQGKGFIFTLNQDLFLEKLVNKHLSKESKFSQYRINYAGNIDAPYINSRWSTQLPTKKIHEEWLSKPNLGGQLYLPRYFPYYVKLHGSSGWKKPNDKLHIPIIGKNKSQQILQEPLLNWYIQLFRETLSDNVDIWVIGYSFLDVHINEILANSMEQFGSSLFVIDIKSFNDFMSAIESLGNKNLLNQIDRSLKGYFPHGLKQLFPLNDEVGFSYQYSSLNRILDNIDNREMLNPFIEVA